MIRVKPRKIIIKNIWLNMGMAKFSTTQYFWPISYNYYRNIDNHVKMNARIG
jgi:hypothetical protein